MDNINCYNIIKYITSRLDCVTRYERKKLKTLKVELSKNLLCPTNISRAPRICYAADTALGQDTKTPAHSPALGFSETAASF